MLKRRYVETSICWNFVMLKRPYDVTLLCWNVVILKRRYVETLLKRIVVNIFLRSSCIDALLQWLPIIFMTTVPKKLAHF